MQGRTKVIIAEKDMAEAAELADVVRQQAGEPILARDAVAVMTMALRHRPSALILGARLPAGGAQLALRRLRSSVHTATIPVIAVVEPGPGKQELLAVGVEACLDAPVDVPELVAALETHLGGGRKVQGAPPEVLTDPQRLRALHETGLVDSEPDDALDIITRLAASILGAPVALVSLVDDRRQFFKSQIGLPEPWDLRRQTPLSHSFCQWVVSSGQEVVISDARTHPVLRANGAVSDLGVVAYAGVPLSAPTGDPIGAFCAIDGKPRPWSDDELCTLRDLGQVVDAYTALNQVRQVAPGAAREAGAYRAAQAAARGFVGAARLLGRGSVRPEERQAITRIVERHGHLLSEVLSRSEVDRAAA